MYQITRSRLVDVPAEHLDWVHAVIDRVGIARAPAIVGLGRTALLGLIARGRTTAGSAALLREAFARREAA